MHTQTIAPSDFPMPIITPRLIIRPRTRDDVDIIHEAKQAMKPALRQWMSWSSEDQFLREATEGFIERGFQDPWELLDGLMAMHRDTGELVVMTGLRRKEKPGQFATGYWVTEPYLRQGYASEACNAMIRYAFGAVGATEVYIDHFVGNIPSQRVIEKMGFTYTHTVDDHFCHAAGTNIDARCYSRTSTVGLPDLNISWG